MKESMNGNIAADLARKLIEHGVPPELLGDRKPAMQMFIDPLSKKVDEWRQDEPDAVTGAAEVSLLELLRAAQGKDLTPPDGEPFPEEFITPEGLAKALQYAKRQISGGN